MGDYQKVEIIKEGLEDPSLQEEHIEQEATQEEQSPQAEEQRPEWLPEKFDSPEAMAKAYESLESQFTKQQQTTEVGEENAEETNETASPISVEKFTEYDNEFINTGEISEQSRQDIEAMGIPREMIDAYISGQQAVVSQQFNDIYSEVGGEDNYTEMLSWASENIPEDEQDAFNESVLNGTPAQMMFAIKSLASRWGGGAGQSAPLIQGNTGSIGASGAFRSLAQVTEAMRDPRYTKDPAYRKEVEDKLSNSNVI